MICFPNAKINIGLRIIEKRSDCFHNIETVFYPIHGLYDCLEIVDSNEISFTNSGLVIDAPIDKNLCVQAWRKLHELYKIPVIAIYLHKVIPFGAGLGGGSADAAFLLVMLNEYFDLKIDINTLQKIALTIGSDCPFFIKNTPVFAEGRGEVFTECNVSLQGKYIVLVNPNIHVSTAEAYGGVKPRRRENTLLQDICISDKQWKGIVENDFETTVFANHPRIGSLKNQMYDLGAEYAAMSGSGSTVFGIFSKEIDIPQNLPTIWKGFLK